MTTLFEKLGGKAAVNAAVDIFYAKVMADDKINYLFKNVDMPRQIAKQKAFLTYAFGGAPNYSGKNMREAHKHLKLTEEHFNAVAGHLKSTLEELSVPDDIQDEVMSIAASTHDDVLNL
ncbi:MAG: group 1 truncated hemoglobin [Alphaproteobacteria bacterium CG11_big_fil_rev_8_21_14_0_20_39_49]|nr:MAG: group 1 truncated hemoglobin [Alphaproteobacteria bacterium CG11_big_fil_rev_8_21_14_0_20_39_49]